MSGCDYADMSGVAEQTLYMGLSVMGPISMDGSVFPADLGAALNDIYHVEGFPWPVRNCEVFVELDMDFGEIKLTDLRADWTTKGGSPALHVDFDFTPGGDIKVAEGEIDSDVDCPNPLNELVVQPYTPNGSYDIDLTGVDLDAWVKLSFDGADVTADLQTRVTASSLDLDPSLSSYVRNHVGDFEDIVEDNTGIAVDDIEDMLADAIHDALAGSAAEIESLVEDAVPDGQVICSLEVNGGELELVTDDPGFMSCVRFIHRPIGSIRLP